MYGAGAEKPLQKADFAMKETNICRLSGDITMKSIENNTPSPMLSVVGVTMKQQHLYDKTERVKDFLS